MSDYGGAVISREGMRADESPLPIYNKRLVTPRPRLATERVERGVKLPLRIPLRPSPPRDRDGALAARPAHLPAAHVERRAPTRGEYANLGAGIRCGESSEH